jgi:hypothetical protein
VERRVEHGDVHGVREARSRHPDRVDGQHVVQGGDLLERDELRNDPVVDHRRLGEAVASVHHPVPDQGGTGCLVDRPEPT